VIPADATFNGTFPFAPHFSGAPGFRMHYVDEGAGSPIVLLHGEPTWGYLYRNFIPPLSRSNRVIVPDHMGFGKSETPQDREYTLRTHVENLAALIEELDLTEITFVIQDWGGPIGGCYTALHPERVKRLCLLNTIVPLMPPAPLPDKPERTPWFEWIGDGLEDGTVDAVLGNLGSTVLSVMKIIGFENSAAVDRNWIDAYSAPFDSREECLGAIEFPIDAYQRRAYPFFAECAENVEAVRAKPAMLVEGMRDRAIYPQRAISQFEALWPEGPITLLEEAGHFCQEDAPETIVPLIQQFIQTT
jgi:haloalkane dehalogenase